MPTILKVRCSPTESRSPRSSCTVYQHSYLFPALQPGHLGFFARSLTGPGNPLSGAITCAARRQINQNHIRLFRHLSFSFYCLLLTRKCAHCAANALGIQKVCKNVISSSYYHAIQQRLSEFPRRFSADSGIILLQVLGKVKHTHFNTCNISSAIPRELNYFHQILINILLGLRSFRTTSLPKFCIDEDFFVFHILARVTSLSQPTQRLVYGFQNKLTAKFSLHLHTAKCGRNWHGSSASNLSFIHSQMANLTEDIASLQLQQLFAV